MYVIITTKKKINWFVWRICIVLHLDIIFLRVLVTFYFMRAMYWYRQ